MKNIKKIIFLITILFLGSRVSASSVSIKVSSGSITKGEPVTVTAVVNADSGIYTTEGTLSCSGAGVSASAAMTYEDIDTKSNSKSFPLVIKPTSSGTVTCTTSNVKLRELAVEKGYSLNNASTSISVSEPVIIKKPTKEYSSNNYLKSLSVEGYDITPNFNKETKEYSLEVPNGTEKVVIKADKENGYASIEGIGEVKVIEGINKIEIKVTAENGNVRVYILNITVKELDPIEVVIDKARYTIVRKEVEFDIPKIYEKSEIKIDDENVLCYKNKNTNNILLLLKDSKGALNLYSYDSATKKYTLYNGFEIGALYLNILELSDNKIPSGYKKVTIKYNDKNLVAYQKTSTKENADSAFYLIYAVNELTGKESLYTFDKEENTVQRYTEDIITKDKNYNIYFIIAISILLITVITLTILLIKKSKHKSRFA